MPATSITLATTPGDQVYSVGAAMLSVDLPTYTWFPSQSHTTFIFSLTTAPSFVTLGGSPLQIQIDTNNGSDTGIYPVTILITETNSGLTDTQNFTLVVKCVQTITPVAALADVLYYITDTTITRSHAYTLFPADCTNELTYDVKLQNGEPLPPSITHAAPIISVFTSDFAVETSYVVKVVATDPKTGVTNAQTTLNVVIKCTKTVDLISGAITDFAYRIVLSSPFEMPVALPAYDVNPSGCPKQAFTFQMLYLDSPTFPAFITQVPTVDVRVLTQNVSFVGLHNFKLQVTEPLTGLINDQDTFVCTILDANYAIALNFVTEIVDTAYLVNSPEIVLDAPTFQVTPADADVSYSYSLVNAPLFVTLVPQGAGSSKISIVTTSSADTGIYTIGYKITEAFSSLSITDTFVLNVQCVTDIQQLSSVAPATYYINDPAQDVLIPLYSLTPASCPYELNYAAALSNGDLLPHAITLQSSGSNFLRLLETDPTLIGVYQVRVTVTDPKTALVNNTLLIDVTVLCTKQISLVTNLIPAESVYTINKSVLLTTVHPLPVYEPNPNNCNSLALSYQVELNPVQTFPGFITETPASQIEIASTDPLDANIYNLRLVVIDSLTGLSNNVVLFEVDVVAISALTLNAVTAIADKVYKVNDPAIVLPVPQYTQTPAYAETKFTYSLIAPTPYFVTLLGSGDETSNVQIVTSSHVDTGTYTVTIQTYEEYSQITKTYSFQLLVTCVHSILTTSTLSDVVYYIGDTQIQIPVPSYGLTPSECPIELFYDVKQSNGNPLPNAITVDQSTFGLETINIYETNQNVAALYTVRVKAFDTKTQIESDLITFQVTVRLRATGLVLIAGTEVADFTYLVGAAAAYLDVPEYEVLPVNANTNCLHALAPSTPSFVTIDGDPYGSPKIKIVSVNVLDTGIYNIDVTYTDTFSGIQKTDTFVLTVFCVSSIQQLNTVASVVYFITDPTISVSLPAYSITPAACPYEIQVTSVTLVDDSALPNSIVFDGVNTVHVQENTYTATGIYQVKVNVIDPKSLVTNSALIFNVTVKCTKQIDVVNVNLPASSPFEIDSKHLNTLPFTQPTFQPFPQQCTIGTYTYQLADNFGTVLAVPLFITTFDNTSLVVATTDITFEGTHDYSIKVTESVSSLVNNQVQFQLVFTVKVYATQMTVVTATLISDQNYLLGSPAMMLPVPEYDFVPTNSILNVVYTLVNPPPFVTIVESTGTWVQVLTSDATNTNVYVIEVKTTDNESGLFMSQFFNLIVSCVRQIDVPAALLDVEYFITDAAIERYPSFLFTPSDCPNELVYLVTRQDDSPLPGSITFNNSRVNPIISVQEQNYLLTAIYQVKVVVTDPKTSQQNSAYLFTVNVKCTKTIEVAAGHIADFSYRIDLDAPWTDSVQVPQYVPNPPQCLAETYSLQVVLTEPGSFPVFINEFPTTNLIIATQDVSNVGVYNFKIRATESITGLVNDSNSFVVTIQEPIYTQDLTLVTATAIADFTYWINEPEMQLDAPRYDVVPANADRQISYSLDPSTPAFVTLIPTASGVPKVSVTSGSNADVGVHYVSIVTTEFWSSVSKTFTFQLTVACIRNIQQLNVIAPTVYYIYDPAIELTVPVYSLTPATCLPTLIYSANQLNGSPLPHAISLVEQAGSQVIKIDETNPLSTGVYTVVVQVVDSFSLNTNSQLQVQVTVKCTKSITLLDNPLLPLSFNVGTEVLSSVSLPLPTYWPFPSDCDFGPFSYQLVYVENPTGSFPPFISQFPQTDIVVSTQSTTYLGDRHFQIIAKDQMTGLENNEVTELVTLYCQVTSLTTELKWFKDDIYYTPGAEPQLVVELPTYQTVPSRCIEPYTTEIFLQVTPEILEPLPDWITLAADEKTFVIYSSDLNLSGVFEFKVQTHVAKYSVLNDELTFVIRLECRIKSILADTWISDYTYIIQPDRGVIEELALPGLIVDPDYCPQHFMFSVVTVNSSVKASSFVSVDGENRMLQFQSRDISLLGSYQIRVVALEPKYSSSATIILNVHLDCIVTKIENAAKFTSLSKYQYTIGDAQKTIRLPDYDQYPAGCVKPLSFSLLLTEIDGVPITEDPKMPTFITINSISQEIVLFGLNMHEGKKTYTFFLLASEPKSGVSEPVPWSFMMDVQLNNKPPEFLYKVSNVVLTEQLMSAGNVRIKLPPIIDKEGNKIVQIQPSFKDAESFLTFDSDQLEFVIDSKNAQLAEPKAYTISIRLVDEFQAASVTTFVIELQPDKIQQRLKDIALKQTDILYFDDDIFYDLTMSDFVQEDQGQLVLQEFTNIIESGQNEFDVSSSFTAKISPVSMNGSFKVDWSDEIFPMRKFNVIAKNVVAVRVIWMNESILQGLEPQPAYKVKLVDLTHEHISFKLLFDDPSLISMGSMLDIVEVHFRNPDFFVRQKDFAKLSEKSRILIQQIPRQVELEDEISAVSKLVSAGKNTAGVGLGSMAIASLAGVSGVTFWGAFNTIQLITMQAYTGSQMPSNAANLFFAIDEFMRGSVANPGQYFQKYFLDKKEVTLPVQKRELASEAMIKADQQVQQMVSDQFIPKSPVVEAGFFFTGIVFCIICSALLAIFESMINCCSCKNSFFVRRVFRPIKNIFTFKLMIYLLQFGYVYFVLSGIKKRTFEKSLIAYGSSLQVVNTTLFYLVFAYITIYPLSVGIFFSLAGEKGLTNKIARGYFGALYSGIDLSNPLNAQYVTLFLLRRFAIGAAIAFLRSYYNTQLIVLQLTSMLVLTVVIALKPYSNQLTNVVEIANESLVIVTIYLMHGFSFYIPSQVARFQLGWAYIGIVLLVFLINTGAVLQGIVRFALLKLRQQKPLVFSRSMTKRLQLIRAKRAETERTPKKKNASRFSRNTVAVEMGSENAPKASKHSLAEIKELPDEEQAAEQKSLQSFLKRKLKISPLLINDTNEGDDFAKSRMSIESKIDDDCALKTTQVHRESIVQPRSFVTQVPAARTGSVLSQEMPEGRQSAASVRNDVPITVQVENVDNSSGGPSPSPIIKPGIKGIKLTKCESTLSQLCFEPSASENEHSDDGSKYEQINTESRLQTAYSELKLPADENPNQKDGQKKQKEGSKILDWNVFEKEEPMTGKSIFEPGKYANPTGSVRGRHGWDIMTPYRQESDDQGGGTIRSNFSRQLRQIEQGLETPEHERELDNDFATASQKQTTSLSKQTIPQLPGKMKSLKSFSMQRFFSSNSVASDQNNTEEFKGKGLSHDQQAGKSSNLALTPVSEASMESFASGVLLRKPSKKVLQKYLSMGGLVEVQEETKSNSGGKWSSSDTLSSIEDPYQNNRQLKNRVQSMQIKDDNVIESQQQSKANTNRAKNKQIKTEFFVAATEDSMSETSRSLRKASSKDLQSQGFELKEENKRTANNDLGPPHLSGQDWSESQINSFRPSKTSFNSSPEGNNEQNQNLQVSDSEKNYKTERQLKRKKSKLKEEKELFSAQLNNKTKVIEETKVQQQVTPLQTAGGKEKMRDLVNKVRQSSSSLINALKEFNLISENAPYAHKRIKLNVPSITEQLGDAEQDPPKKIVKLKKKPRNLGEVVQQMTKLKESSAFVGQAMDEYIKTQAQIKDDYALFGRVSPDLSPNKGADDSRKKK